MSIRNALLCGLIGYGSETVQSLDETWTRTPEDTLVLAMHLFANDRLNEVARLCRQHPKLDVAALAQYVLFLGLTRNVSLAFRAFDVLKSTAPRESGVWLNNAYLHAVCGQPMAASRAITVHAILTGRQPPRLDLPVEADEDVEIGLIRFMAGDVAMPLPEGDGD